MTHEQAAAVIQMLLGMSGTQEQIILKQDVLRALLDGYTAAVKDMKYASDQRVCSDESEICTICEHNNGQDCGGCWKLDHKEEAL